MDGTSASSELDVLNWIRQFNVKYPVAYDPILNVANLYLQGGFPTFAIIGTQQADSLPRRRRDHRLASWTRRCASIGSALIPGGNV